MATDDRLAPMQSGAPAARTRRSRVRLAVPGRERAAQALLWLAAVAAAGSAVSAVSDVAAAGGTTRVVETWRAYGFLVFAGLFVLLALRPHGYRGVWELVIANKVALTVTALAYASSGGIAGTGTIIGWDGGLSVLLVAAYVLSRAWASTATSRRRDSGGPAPVERTT